MLKNLSILLILGFFTASFITLNGCGDDKTDPESSGQNTELYTKDDAGERVKLVLKPQEKDTLKYKMVAKSTETERSTDGNAESVTIEQEISYYYTQIVDRVEETAVTYKMQYDSIVIVSKIQSPDSTVSIVYNSNVKDSVYNFPDFIQFNGSIAAPFYMRVSDKGTVLDLFGMEKIYENIFKALGDTLSANDKGVVQNSIGESMKAVLQQQFQKFPEDSSEVFRDSSWSTSYETQLSVFPVKNLLSYKVTDITEEDGNILVTLEASMNTEVMQKEVSEQNTKALLENIDAGGTGKIVYNLSGGYIKSKETETKIDAKIKLSQGSQSMTSDKTQTSSVNVQLL